MRARHAMSSTRAVVHSPAGSRRKIRPPFSMTMASDAGSQGSRVIMVANRQPEMTTNLTPRARMSRTSWSVRKEMRPCTPVLTEGGSSRISASSPVSAAVNWSPRPEGDVSPHDPCSAWASG